MTDDCVSAFDRLDHLHATYPLPQTCTRCSRNSTTSRDLICGACRFAERLAQGWTP